MKLFCIAFLFIGSNVLSQSEVPLQYQIEMVGNSLHVDLLYQPVEKDSSTFTYGEPAFGGMMDILKGLRHLSVQAPARVKLDSASRTITLYFNSNQPIRISYEIADTRKLDNTRNQLFRPIIMTDYIFIHGVNLFLTPAFRASEVKPLVSVSWKKLPDFPIFNTFDPDNNGSRTTTTTADSIAFRFITGAKDLTVKKFKTESGTNYLVLRTTDVPQKAITEIENFYAEYNTVMRQYWKDKRIIKYSLVLQPFINVNHKMSGVSFGNGFIGKYNKPDSLAYGERKFVVAHEIGHYYLGDLKAFGGNHNEGQWFDEGFNDYTTYFNLLRSKGMTSEEFESGFNKILKHLYTSPIKNTPNDKIFENFWKLGDYSKLPYWRGCVFAFYLDNQIALATRNKNSIRDLMLDLQQLVKERPDKQFSNDEFIQAVSRFLPRESFSKAFNEFIVNGATITFENSRLLPIFKVEVKDQVPVITIVNKKKFVAHFQFK